MRKKGYKRVLGLRKWNKIVSALVKDYKKRKEDYNIKDVRKEASEIYKSFKAVPLSKLSQKAVKKTKATLGKLPKELKVNTIRILATDIPKSEIDKVGGFRYFELEGILDFNAKFPEVPILIKTPDNELKINGLVGAYGGSDLANFVNDNLRQEYGEKEKYDILFESSVALQEKNNIPYLLIVPEDLPDNEIKKLLKKKVKFPKRKDVKVEIEKRIKTEEEKKADKKRKKAELPKKKKKPKKPVTKPKTEPKKEKKPPLTRRPTPLADKNKAKELLLKEYELGLITKKQYLADRKKIDELFSKGGKI